ncbi:hypothetical protein F01_421147 [Burkholderia cenocepacia]|nr:hypothetical protein F01_421147 [Burkholderia cenocepacia]
MVSPRRHRARADRRVGDRRAHRRERSARPDLRRDAGRVRAGHRVGRTAGQDRHLDVGAAARLCAGRAAGVRADVAGGIHAHRPRSADDAHVDVQSAAVDRVAADRAAVVRARHRQPAVRARACGAVAARAQHLYRFRRRARHAENGRAQLWAHGPAPDRADPRAGRAAVDPVGPARRLGLRVAHADRGRARVRRERGAGRPRLVHLPEPQRAVHGPRVRGPRGRHRDRAAGREPRVRYARTRDRAALGDSALTRPSAINPGAGIT